MDKAAQLDELRHLLAQRIGLRLPHDANDRFDSTLQERATRSGHANLSEYRMFLTSDKASREWEELVRTFTSSETFFFRDQGQFDLLRLSLLPELIARYRLTKSLRIWSAGCASGEEAYSLAMLVDMLLPDRSEWDIRILGTDIDSTAIAKAKEGHYRQWSFRMVPAALQQRYFHEVGNEWELDDRIRRMVRFNVTNLVDAIIPNSESDLYDMDLILCRNVFIYFDQATVLSVAEKLAATLVEGGYLMTAHTELMGYPMRHLESRLFPEGVVYQRHAHLPACVKSVPVPSINVEWVAPSFSAVSLAVENAQNTETQALKQTAISPANEFRISARAYADQGEYDLAERMCREALATDPLVVAPYFLLAQLAEIKGDSNQAKECLNKAIYLDHRYVAAYLELATLHERDGNMHQAKSLRQIALGIVRDMPKDEQIEQYERTAGELAQWLVQFEASTNSHVNENVKHASRLKHGE